MLSVPFCDFLAPQRTDQLAYRLVGFFQLLLKFRSGFEAKKSLVEHQCDVEPVVICSSLRYGICPAVFSKRTDVREFLVWPGKMLLQGHKTY